MRVLEGVLKPYKAENLTGCTLCMEYLAKVTRSRCPASKMPSRGRSPTAHGGGHRYGSESAVSPAVLRARNSTMLPAGAR